MRPSLTALLVIALATTFACEGGPVAEGSGPTLEAALAQDARLFELVALSYFTVEELAAMDYPVEKGEARFVALAAQIREEYGPALQRAANEPCEPTPFAAVLNYGPGGGELAPAEWPEWMKAAWEQMRNMSCERTKLALSMTGCALGAAGTARVFGPLVGTLAGAGCGVLAVDNYCVYEDPNTGETRPLGR